MDRNELWQGMDDCAATLPVLLNEAFPLKVDPYCDPNSESDPHSPHVPRYMAGGMNYEHAPMITLELGLLLYSFVRHNKPIHIVETGTCHGNSSAWMAAGLKDNHIPAKLTTFDILVENPNPQDLWRRVGVDHLIEFVNGTIWDNVAKVPNQIDFAFIDSQHNVETILKEMAIVWPRLSTYGVVAFDDYTLYPECRETMHQYFPNLIFPLGRGLVIGQKRS